MITSYHRPTKAVIDTAAITANVAGAIKKLNGTSELFAVVKADGYGHGATAVAHAAIAGGATGFCVATIDEGIDLRQAGFTQPILVLGVTDARYTKLILEYDLSITITTLADLAKFERELATIVTSGKLKIHLKIDTGMGRIGFLNTTDLQMAVEKISTRVNMEWEGIFTHFAKADTQDDTYWLEQRDIFSAFLASLTKLPRYIHINNSATTLWHPNQIGNLVRYGVAMYGLNPSGGELALEEKLQPAFELVSELVQVKRVPAGTHISYGATYTSQQAEWIGTVPIGYADGWLRKMQGFTLLVEGSYCEIVGRICMDQLMIRLPQEFSVGTKVTLIGKNGGETITMQEVADYLGTIHYEVACTISDRVPREYRK
ncbi:alanine racemase [Enterococcus sp. LJL90]